jgi:hypothetical protein
MPNGEILVTDTWPIQMGDSRHVPNAISIFHDSRPTDTWHTSHVSTSPPGDVIMTHHFYSFVSEHRALGVCATTHPILPTVELPNLQSTLLLDPTIRLFSPDLRCRSPSRVRASMHSTSPKLQTWKGFQKNFLHLLRI